MAQLVGIDIGYSNLKVVGGVNTGFVPDLGRGGVVVPSGAAPAERVGKMLSGQGVGVDVRVGGRDWVAGVAQDRVTGWERTLDENFPVSDAYMALYLAGLRLVNAGNVDLLVTGLPVSQFADAAYRRRLEQRLTGSFELGAGKRALVHAVHVVPQPIGGYSDAMQSYPTLEDECVLVIDPGFFSVDWILVDRGAYLADLCSTSSHAVSSIIDRTIKQLLAEGIDMRQPEYVEAALRSGARTILVGGRHYEIDRLVSAAALEVGKTAVAAISSSLRGWKRRPDRVVLVGGGARLYEPAVRQAFGADTLSPATSPVLANARGFWVYGANKIPEAAGA